MKLLDILSDPRTPLVLAAVAAFLRVLYALVSRLVQPYPRARAVVEAFAALLPDVLRAGLQIVAAWTGRPAPRLDAPIDGDPNLRAEQALQNAVTLSASSDGWRRRALAAEARVAELAAAEEPGRLRPTVVPGEEPARSPDETTVSGRRRLPPGTLGTMALLALVLGTGCPRLPPVSGCEPLSQRCEGDRPQVCSPSRRWHTVGDEACGVTPGQRCEVRAGVAGCAR